jgi:hypothetical protein
MNMSRSFRLAVVLVALALGGLASPSAAHAWWRGGIGFGFVPFAPYPAPYYYPPPPVYYAPPPAYYPPPAGGQACYARAYTCPLAQPTPVGALCSCPTNDSGRVGGRVG